MTFTKTPEQEAIVDAVRSTKRNILVEALAGAAKTSSLVMAAGALPLEPTLSVAFNKKIAEEMALRMPGHITSKTLNSIGHGVWGKRLGRRLVLETGKTYGLIKEAADAASGSERSAINDNFAGLMRALRLAKSSGYVPPGQFRQVGAGLLETDEFIDTIATELDTEPDDFLISIIDRALEKSIAMAFEGTIDFDDQLYCPTLFGGAWPKYPVTLVDEAQDLSPLNHLMLEKLYGGRLIAVGDPYQSIYGFRGAHASSMEWLRSRFDMAQLGLSVSFRCPQAVVRKANGYVPHMRYPAWAAEGVVSSLLEWGSDQIPDGAAIICRSNAPLFSMALRLLRQGRSCTILGKELGPALVKQMKKIGGGKDLAQDDFLKLVDEWEVKELKAARESRKAVIHDRAECYRVFALFAPTLNGAIAYAETVFKQEGKISLMTGHKAKGLEFDVVFHLDPWRIPSKYAKEAAANGDDSKLVQEQNLQYVVLTRAKREYYEVNLEDFT